MPETVAQGALDGVGAPQSAPAVPAGQAPEGFVTRAEYEQLQRESHGRRLALEEAQRSAPAGWSRMSPEDREAFGGFVDSYTRGDVDGSAEWLIASARQVAGDRFDALVRGGATPGQAATQVAAEQGQQAPAGLTLDDVDRIMDERFRQQQVAAVRERTREELASMGYSPDGPHAAGLLAYATANRQTIREAQAGYEDSLLAEAQRVQANRAARIGGGFGSAPTGQAGPTFDPEQMRTPEGRKAALRAAVSARRMQ